MQAFFVRQFGNGPTKYLGLDNERFGDLEAAGEFESREEARCVADMWTDHAAAKGTDYLYDVQNFDSRKGQMGFDLGDWRQDAFKIWCE